MPKSNNVIMSSPISGAGKTKLAEMWEYYDEIHSMGPPDPQIPLPEEMKMWLALRHGNWRVGMMETDVLDIPKAWSGPYLAWWAEQRALLQEWNRLNYFKNHYQQKFEIEIMEEIKEEINKKNMQIAQAPVYKLRNKIDKTILKILLNEQE